MTIDERISCVKELIAKRENIDRQLTELFSGTLTVKKSVRCSVCGGEGHNAKSCPTKHKHDDASNSNAL